MIKAKDLIKKEQDKRLYDICEQVAFYLFNKSKRYERFREIDFNCFNYYYIQVDEDGNPIYDTDRRDIYFSKIRKLAKRLEREFLRVDEKIKLLDTREFITIIYLDYERKQLIKSVLEDIKGLINEFANCYMWLRGDVSLTNFEQVRESLHWQFDKDDLLKTFNKGMGEYFFKTVWEEYDDYEYHYEFELIDFKPLELINMIRGIK